MNIKIQYADYRAGDAFLAGHFGEWVNCYKSKMTKTQLAHLVAIMETYYMDVFEGTQDPDKMSRHLNMVFEDINETEVRKASQFVLNTISDAQTA